MTETNQTENRSGDVNIRVDGSISVGRDFTGRDKIKNVTVERNISASSTELEVNPPALIEMLTRWRTEMEAKIEAQTNLSDDDKRDLKEKVDEIQTEAAKGGQADLNRLGKLINTLAIMSSDIFQVAITTLTNPLAGIGLTLKKIGDKAQQTGT